MYRLDWIAEQVGAQLRGDASCVITRVDTLIDASAGAISFLANPRYRKFLATTQATAVIVSSEHLDECQVNALVSDDPHLCFARVALLLSAVPEVKSGIHKSAVVADVVGIAEDAWIGPCAVIEKGALIGPGAFIGPGCVIGKNARIGANSRLVARVSICDEVEIGERVLIHPGAVIGSDGFSFARGPEGWVKIPQFGTVRIGDDVEIGANTTIDRGAIRDTVIERGVKLDNQIQIAHNVSIGEHSAIAGCVGISGSTTVGRNCTLGGGVGLAGHLTFGDNTHFTGQSLVTRSFSEPGCYSGNVPALPSHEWRKAVARFRHLDEMTRRIKQLEHQVSKLSEDVADKRDC